MFITLCHGAFIVWPLNGGMIVSGVPRDKFDCDNELLAVPIPSTLHSPLFHASHTSPPPPFSAGDPGEEEAEESEGPEGQGRRRRRRCRRGERRDDFLPLWRRRAQRELRQTIQVGRMKGSLSAHGDGYVAGNAHSQRLVSTLGCIFPGLWSLGWKYLKYC